MTDGESKRINKAEDDIKQLIINLESDIGPMKLDHVDIFRRNERLIVTIFVDPGRARIVQPDNMPETGVVH